MASETVGLALIGSGRIGAVHLANMIGNSRIDVRWVVDVDEKSAKKNAALTSHAKPTTNVDDALNDSSVHGIVICTPTAAHKEIILKAAKAGKAIMCEKPISLITKEIDECYEECKKLKVPLLCGYQRRSDPSFVKLKETCKKGGIGTVQTIKTISRDNPVPTLAYLKISGKIFHDCGSHDIDVCRWIAEEDPCQVFAVASAFNPDIKALEDWDTVLITLKFPSGKLANIDLSRKACYGYDQRIEVLGDKGMVQAQNRQPTTTVVSTVDGISTDPFCYSFPQRYTEAYAHEMDHFVDVILKKAEPKLSHEDARKVAIIAEAAEESCKIGKPVDLKY